MWSDAATHCASTFHQNTDTSSHRHTYTHIDAHTHTQTHTYHRRETTKPSHADSLCAYCHTDTHRHTHRRTHAHARTHAHTHTIIERPPSQVMLTHGTHTVARQHLLHLLFIISNESYCNHTHAHTQTDTHPHRHRQVQTHTFIVATVSADRSSW